jgi:hypothetical protein
MGKRIDKVATDLARKIWRLEGHCEGNDVPDSVWECISVRVGNTSPQLQGAHIYGVGAYPRLKTDLRNGMSLCSNCHRHFTSSPLEFTDFVRRTKYKKYLQPLRDVNNGPKIKMDWDDRLAFLKDVFKQVRDGEMTLDEARAYDEED